MAQQAASTVTLWPEDKIPGHGAQDAEMDLPSRGDGVQRITNISNPTLTLYPVFWKKSPSPAMIVCPGGAYSYVAYTREGSEVAEWLNSIGITALVLKYRVPDNRAGALQDIQRAISLARANASKWNIDPDRIGVIGFSAGGNLCAKASNLFDTRAYEAIDDVDKLSCRPDFTVLVYPAYLEKNGKIAGDLNLKANIPPTLIVHSDDDKSFIAGTRIYVEALEQADHPYKFLCYPTGGHGYGLNSKGDARLWPKDAAEWLHRIGAVEAPFGFNRDGKPLWFPPGVEPGMQHPDYNPKLPTLWLIGDSTVKCGRDDGLDRGLWGWGHEIGRYFDTSRINVENQALGGTSSRSFIAGGWWKSVLEMIRPGDYLLIQFGHNDGQSSLPGNGDETEERPPRKGGEPQTTHSYGWYIRKYISDARAKGATPIVCSLIPRNDWRDGRIIRAQDKSYVLWAQKAAEQENAFFINLNHIICDTLDTLGEEFSLGAIFRPDDHTHTTLLGAQFNAYCVVSGIKALGHELSLGEYLSPTAEPVEPSSLENVLKRN